VIIGSRKNGHDFDADKKTFAGGPGALGILK